MSLRCWSCDADIGPLRTVGREEICSKCEAWVHCCKNCRWWDDAARACDEPAAEWVHDRERANFCDFFTLSSEERRPGGRRDDEGSSGRAAFDALFDK